MKINLGQTREVTESSGNRFPDLSILPLFLVLLIVPCPGIDTGFGEKKAIKTILINGITGSEKDLLMSELLSREGDILSEKTVEADRRHLNRLGLFRTVEIKSVPNGQDVNLEILVIPRARYLPMAYMGASEGNSFSLGGGVQSIDFLGSGLIFTGKARTGGESRLSLKFHSPGLRTSPLDFSWSFLGVDRFNDLDSFQEKSIDTESRLSRRLSENFRAGG